MCAGCEVKSRPRCRADTLIQSRLASVACCTSASARRITMDKWRRVDLSGCLRSVGEFRGNVTQLCFQNTLCPSVMSQWALTTLSIWGRLVFTMLRANMLTIRQILFFSNSGVNTKLKNTQLHQRQGLFFFFYIIYHVTLRRRLEGRGFYDFNQNGCEIAGRRTNTNTATVVFSCTCSWKCECFSNNSIGCKSRDFSTASQKMHSLLLASLQSNKRNTARDDSCCHLFQ